MRISNSRVTGPSAQTGFTLTELMIAIAVIAILSAFALPMYRNYIQTSQLGVLVSNMDTLQVFQEDFRLRTGAYAVNLADKAAIEATVGWNPRDGAEFTYAIAAGDGTTYQLTASDGEGNTVCRVYPEGAACP